MSRGFPITRAIRELRRKQAAVRQEEYDKLTIEQKLARLPPPPHCARQRARLEKQRSLKKNTPR